MLKSLFFLFLFSVTIGFSQEDSALEAPQIVIRVPLGEAVEIDDITVRFSKVLEDSRCPRNVQCVWAGRAKVEVEIIEAKKDVVKKELVLGQTRGAEISDKVIFTSENMTVKVKHITPYPDEPGQKLDYKLLISKLKIKKD